MRWKAGQQRAADAQRDFLGAFVTWNNSGPVSVWISSVYEMKGTEQA